MCAVGKECAIYCCIPDVGPRSPRLRCRRAGRMHTPHAHPGPRPHTPEGSAEPKNRVSLLLCLVPVDGLWPVASPPTRDPVKHPYTPTLSSLPIHHSLSHSHTPLFHRPTALLVSPSSSHNHSTACQPATAHSPRSAFLIAPQPPQKPLTHRRQSPATHSMKKKLPCSNQSSLKADART